VLGVHFAWDDGGAIAVVTAVVLLASTLLTLRTSGALAGGFTEGFDTAVTASTAFDCVGAVGARLVVVLAGLGWLAARLRLFGSRFANMPAAAPMHAATPNAARMRGQRDVTRRLGTSEVRENAGTVGAWIAARTAGSRGRLGGRGGDVGGGGTEPDTGVTGTASRSAAGARNGAVGAS
jgi:hypothetical protein